MPVKTQVQDSSSTIEYLVKMGLWDQAEKLCLATMQLQGENAQLLNYLGVIDHNKGRLEEALSKFQKAEYYAPNNAELKKNITITKRSITAKSQTGDAPGQPNDQAAEPMEFTGERFVPQLTGQMAYEHYHRYAFALEFAKGKNVLDIASGEGFGAALLADCAESVWGIDVSRDAIEHSQKNYRRTKNLKFKEGRCENIQFADNSFDLVVSFETLEHVEDQEAFLSEAKRVLKKDGIFIVSSPNKKVYSDDKNFKNPYHLKELYTDELLTLLSKYFGNVHLYGQRLTFSSHIWPMEQSASVTFVNYTRSGDKLRRCASPPFEDEYTLAVCSSHDLSNWASASLLTSDTDELYRDFHYRGGMVQRLSNELAQERAKAAAKVVQARQVPKPEGSGPEVHAVRSLQQYKTFISDNNKASQERREHEEGLVNGRDKFYLDGYCWICKKHTRLLVDSQYGEDFLSPQEPGELRKPIWRETAVCVRCNANNRIRAFAHFVDTVLKPRPDSAIYLTEQITPLYRYFANHYPKTVGSEYLGTSCQPGTKNGRGVRNEDLTHLTFGDSEFDFVFSLEVLEHIPDYKLALREVLRVLKPTGKFVFTAPFLIGSEKTVIRAKMENGEINHILPPEYHGDPVNGTGCLCYEQFGWDLIDELKDLGFSDSAAFLLGHSDSYGYFGDPHVILVAQKDGSIVAPEANNGARPNVQDYKASIPQRSSQACQGTPKENEQAAQGLERINCPFCGSTDATPFRNVADIVKCCSCGTVYLRTRLTAEGMFKVYQSYADEGSQVSLPRSEGETKSSGLRRDYFLDEIASLVKSRGTFLDIGCAWGAFLDNARSRGFKPRGIEITRKTAEFAAKSLNLDVTSNQFVDTELDTDSISVVSMIHVLEHLPAPKAAIAKTFDVLEPGGLFAGIVPNIESLSSTVLGDRWEWLQPIHHYVHYSPASLRHHLEEAGFIVERMYTTAGDCNRESLKRVLNAVYPQKNDNELKEVLKALEADGYGEEIRFFARKPLEGPSGSTKKDETNETSAGMTAGIASIPGTEEPASPSSDEIYAESQRLISAGKNDEAAKVLETMLSSDPSNSRALNDLAVLYSLAGRLPDSIDLLNKLLQAEPTNIIAGKNLGSIYLRGNKVAEALNCYYRVLKSAPDDTDALLAVGDISLAVGKTDDASGFYRRVLVTDPHNATAEARLATIQNADKGTDGKPVTSQQTAMSLYDKAQTLIQDGKYDEARQTLEAALDIDPNDPSCLNDLAVLFSLNKEIDKAIPLLQRLLEIQPNNAVAKKNLGSLYLQKNDIEKGLNAYFEVLQSTPNDAEVLLTVAKVCLSLDKTEDAKLFFGKVLKATNDPALQRSVLTEIEKIEATPAVESDGTLASHSTTDSQRAPLEHNRPVAMVSIILLVYNKLDFSKRCIESILSTVKYSNYEIVVTDNASTDGTYEFMIDLASRIDNVRYVRNESNLGFVGGCNTGVANARGKYVILLNNDTIVNKGWLESLAGFAERTPDCGAVGSKLIYPNGRLQEAGGIIFSDGNGWNYGRGMNPYDPKYNFVREVDYISGASLMVRKDLWDEIGGLDDRFSPAYFEDSDLCFEVRKHGYKVYYQPKSSIVHFEGTTNGTDVKTGRKKYQVINRPKFVEKWKKELSQQYTNDPRLVEKASSRGIVGRIFVADPLLPMFDRAAGSLHLFNILKALRAMKFHITFVSGYWSLKEYYKPILEDLGIETYAGDPDAMTFMGYTSPYRKIDYPQLFQERNFDYALIDFWYHAEFYVPLLRKYLPKTTVIVDTEDVHFVREMREAVVKGDQELEKKALENKQRELSVYGKADRLWVVTEEDRQALKKESVQVPIDIRPVIHELPDVKNDFENRSGILFVGNFNHRPNADAVEFFVKEVFPLVAKSVLGVKLHIVGNNSEQSVGNFASDNIIIAGYAPDLAQYYNTCRVAVAPLRYGAGLKGKVVESLSYGVPVVTTSVGVEGTGLRDGSELMVADDPREMAERIISVYSSKEVWERLSTRGRAVMQKRWSVDAGRKRIEELMSLAAGKSSDVEERLTSIVILTFNQLKYTKITIDSIRRHTKTPYEIIVVDNASTDGTIEYLKAQRDVRTIFNEQNVGFPAGCNQGIEIAKGDCVVLLNNDVIVTDGWLEGMIECSNVEPHVGIVGPMTNWISGFQLERDIPYKKVSQMPAFAAKYRRKNRKKWIEVPRIAGFCMLIKREVVETIGGLDTLFGIGNCEDDDYCLRAKLAGFKVALAGDVFIHHYGSKSFSQKGLEKYLNVVESKEKLFQEKWGITPSEWWRDGKELTKMSDLKIPLDHFETSPVTADENESTVATEENSR